MIHSLLVAVALAPAQTSGARLDQPPVIEATVPALPLPPLAPTPPPPLAAPAAG